MQYRCNYIGARGWGWEGKERERREKEGGKGRGEYREGLPPLE